MTDPYAEAALAGRPISDHFVMDAHAHLGQHSGFLILDSGYETIVRELDRIGIDMIAVSSIPSTIGGWTRGNDLVMESVQRYPTRFFGYITVNAYWPDEVLKECQRCWEGGCRGLKLHSAQGVPYDDERLRPALDFAEEKECPILFHTWGAELSYMEPMLEKYTRSRWIFAHAGSVQREDYVRLARLYPQAYIETCFSKCPRGLYEYFSAEGVMDKVLWGSDASFMSAGQQIGRVLLAKIPPEEKKKALCDNARHVFGLD